MRIVRGRAFYRGRVEPLDLGIEDGTIVTIKKHLLGDDVEDHGDSLILPGCLDLHVHLRDPGLTEKEDFAHGTASAVLGGVTAVVDMPNTKPPVTTREALEAKSRIARGRASADYGLYAAPLSPASVPRLAGATGFKVYMAETTGGLLVDEHELPGILDAASSLRKLVVAHAEDPRAFRAPKAKGLEGHCQARPKEAEVEAVKTLARIRGSARLHVAHVTCVEALDALPVGITTEVTPHHLLLDWRRPLGAFGKVNPPLRAPEDREALWKAFVDGRIDIVASDHAPHTREEKEEPFEEAPAGIPGIATSFPLLLRLVRSERLPLERLVAAMATRPAELLGVSKGAIEVGRDADLIVVDPRRIEPVTAKRVRYKCGWTPFEGMEAIFPHTVYVRGEAVVEDGEPVGEGVGQPLTPSPE